MAAYAVMLHPVNVLSVWNTVVFFTFITIHSKKNTRHTYNMCL